LSVIFFYVGAGVSADHPVHDISYYQFKRCGTGQRPVPTFIFATKICVATESLALKRRSLS